MRSTGGMPESPQVSTSRVGAGSVSAAWIFAVLRMRGSGADSAVATSLPPIPSPKAPAVAADALRSDRRVIGAMRRSCFNR